MKYVARIVGIVCLFIVVGASVPFLVVGVKNSDVVPHALMYVLVAAAVAFTFDAILSRKRKA